MTFDVSIEGDLKSLRRGLRGLENAGDQQLTLTMAEAIVKSLAQLAAKGNTRAIAMFLEHMKIIDDRQISQAAKLEKEKEEVIESTLESMTTEEIENVIRILGKSEH